MRVRGRVLWGGAGVADRALRLEPLEGSRAAGAPGRGDWDLTGDDGDFDVLLRPGRYAVLVEGRPDPRTTLELRPAAEIKTLHLDLILSRRPPAARP